MKVDLPELFLVKSLGNSGGSWLEGVLNVNPDVVAYEELGHALEGADPLLRQQYTDLACLGTFLYAVGQKKSVGFIKSYGEKTLLIADMVEARRVTLLRNPIRHLHGVRRRVHQATQELGRPPKDALEQFTAQARFQSRRMVDAYHAPWPYWRLEDLSDMLIRGDSSILEMLEWLTRVSYAGMLPQIQAVKPRGRQGSQTLQERFGPFYPDGDDPQAETIWNTIWSQGQRAIFRFEYASIYERMGYQWP